MDFKDDNTVTNAKVVWPFYAYASVSFLAACFFLVLNSDLLLGHYFQPQLLAITHSMAIAWGTMIIFGASFQLLPVIAGKALYSEKLAKRCFYLSAISIPFLVNGFYHFLFDVIFFTAAVVLIVAITLFVYNVYKTIVQSEVIQGDYIFSASIYLFFTVVLGFVLALNFTFPVLPDSSLKYLKLHAHIGVLGWFLFLIIGVGSKLLPMFFFSKYKNDTLITTIYYALHTSLAMFILSQTILNYPWIENSSIAIFFFIGMAYLFYSFMVFKNRIKKKVDITMKATFISMLSILMIAVLVISLLVSKNNHHIQISIVYGFVIFFGWISMLIIGMTFKTLPFIIWNAREMNNKNKSPKDLYSELIFRWMLFIYVLGFVLVIIGIISENILLLKVSTSAILLSSILYNVNVFKILINR